MEGRVLAAVVVVAVAESQFVVDGEGDDDGKASGMARTAS